MKAKIDLEKFICSYVKWSNIQDALRDQGLKCWNGEIVEIPQESEDERIKKEILELVSISGNGNQFEEIKDWLEKQAPKPMWSDEDSLMIDSIIDTMKWLEGKGATNMKIDWLKSLKKRMGT